MTKTEKKPGVEKCILCGLCNGGGDAYRLSLDERRAPAPDAEGAQAYDEELDAVASDRVAAR